MHSFLAELRFDADVVSSGSSPVELWGLRIWFKGYIANKIRFSSEVLGLDPDVDGDVVSVALGYRKWGAALNEHVFGEFAVAIYDAQAETLVLAQDCLGIVPLYYRVQASSICFSPSIDGLAHELDQDDLDEEYIADYLCFGDHHGERTPFKCISRLTPGVSLRLRHGVMRRCRSWAFDHIEPIRCSDVREYSDELQRLVCAGVKAAMPGKGIALCEVSGGLDSSTVACVASRLFPRDRLHALSLVYSDSRTADESFWSQAVVQSCDIRWHRLNVDKVRPFTHLPTERCGQPYHTMVNAALTKAYSNILEANDIAVVLTGAGGDGVLLGDCPEPFFFADMFWRGRLVTVWKGLCQWARDSGGPHPLLYWWNRCVFTASSRRFRRLLIHDEPRRIPWISSRYRLTTSRNGRERKSWVPGNAGVAESWFLEQVIRSAKMLSLRDNMNSMRAEFRHPLMYVPLVRFMYAIPWDLKFSASEDRLLHRHAFAKILPPQVASRRSKGNPSQSTYTGLETGQWWKAIRRGTEMTRRGYLNSERWTAAVDLARLGRCESIMHFKAAATLEVWLDGLQRAARAKTKARTDQLTAAAVRATT
jgi:asparagine synthase (glutamine-hydrolysing)